MTANETEVEAVALFGAAGGAGCIGDFVHGDRGYQQGKDDGMMGTSNTEEPSMTIRSLLCVGTMSGLLLTASYASAGCSIHNDTGWSFVVTSGNTSNQCSFEVGPESRRCRGRRGFWERVYSIPQKGRSILALRGCFSSVAGSKPESNVPIV